MSRVALFAGLVASLSACGGAAHIAARGASNAAASATTGAVVNTNVTGSHGEGPSRCDLSPAAVATFRPVHLDGSRVVVRVPDDAGMSEANWAVIFPCGAALTVLDYPTAHADDDAPLAGFGQFGDRCVERGRDVVCATSAFVMVGRVLRAQRAAALVAAFAGDEDQAELLLELASIDPSLDADPVRASGLVQSAPEGLALSGESIPRSLEYEEPGRSDGAVAVWEYEPFGQFSSDSPSDDELGEHAGRILSRLGIRALSATPLSEELLEVEADRRGAAVRLRIGTFVQDAGVWFFVGAAPAAEADVWMPRFEAHLDQTRGY